MSAGAVKLKPPGITSETFSLVGFIDNSDLFLNLTAQVISRLPEVFHCRATNMLGQTVVATTRSKDVHVTFNCEFLARPSHPNLTMSKTMHVATSL